MPGYKAFEELPVWQAAQALAVCVYQLTSGEHFRRDFALRDQMRRAAISIPSNIAEGFERRSKNQLAYSLNVAKGSAGELRSQLLLAKELGHLKPEAVDGAAEQCREVSRQLSAFASSLRPAK